MSDLWDKALEAADDARLLLRAGRYNGACNRAYYAMFNAARALLADTHDVELSDIKRHATVLRLFSKHFIDGGLFAAEYGPLLRRASEARLVADYDEIPVSEKEAAQIVKAMDGFVEFAVSARKRAR